MWLAPRVVLLARFLQGTGGGLQATPGDAPVFGITKLHIFRCGWKGVLDLVNFVLRCWGATSQRTRIVRTASCP